MDIKFLRAHRQNHRFLILRFCRQIVHHRFIGCSIKGHLSGAAAAMNPAIKKIGKTDKCGHEHIGRPLVNIGRFSNLLDNAAVHDRNAV